MHLGESKKEHYIEYYEETISSARELACLSTKKMPFFVSSKRYAKRRTILVHIFHDTNKRVTSLFFLRRMRQIIAKRKQEGGCGIHYHVIIFILLKGMYENVSIVLILPSTPILWHHTS
jgi:hypothetical protein